MAKCKINEFDLVSPYTCDIPVNGIGKVRKPRLIDIAEAGFENYQVYLMYFIEPVDEGFDNLYGKGKYEKLSNDEKNRLTPYLLFSENPIIRGGFLEAISFFVDGEVSWYEERKCFLVNADFDEDGTVNCDGVIDGKNFAAFADVIAQISNVQREEEEVEQYENELARRIDEAAKMGKRARQRANGDIKTFSLPNVILKLSVYHSSLNFTNMWDLTVYQAYADFAELISKKHEEIGAMNYSTWGGDFDSTAWVKAS